VISGILQPILGHTIFDGNEARFMGNGHCYPVLRRMVRYYRMCTITEVHNLPAAPAGGHCMYGGVAALALSLVDIRRLLFKQLWHLFIRRLLSKQLWHLLFTAFVSVGLLAGGKHACHVSKRKETVYSSREILQPGAAYLECGLCG
jgi:hypothetical protein